MRDLLVHSLAQVDDRRGGRRGPHATLRREVKSSLLAGQTGPGERTLLADSTAAVSADEAGHMTGSHAGAMLLGRARLARRPTVNFEVSCSEVRIVAHPCRFNRQLRHQHHFAEVLP